MTQNNLGVTLWRLGERESGTARLEEAIKAYQAALAEYTRDRVPLQWATTQNNLSLALAMLGERTDDLAKLREAREAIDAAFQVYMQAGLEHQRGYFEERLRELDGLIAALAKAR